MTTTKTKKPDASDNLNSLVRTRPTRRDLLIVLSRLQTIIGRSKSLAQNDRNPNRLENLLSQLDSGFDLCLDVLEFDPPMDGKRSRNGWSEET
jgi:hypothetical protein